MNTHISNPCKQNTETQSKQVNQSTFFQKKKLRMNLKCRTMSSQQHTETEVLPRSLQSVWGSEPFWCQKWDRRGPCSGFWRCHRSSGGSQTWLSGFCVLGEPPLHKQTGQNRGCVHVSQVWAPTRSKTGNWFILFISIQAHKLQSEQNKCIWKSSPLSAGLLSLQKRLKIAHFLFSSSTL